MQIRGDQLKALSNQSGNMFAKLMSEGKPAQFVSRFFLPRADGTPDFLNS